MRVGHLRISVPLMRKSAHEWGTPWDLQTLLTRDLAGYDILRRHGGQDF
jgi:hypothetical protein